MVSRQYSTDIPVKGVCELTSQVIPCLSTSWSDGVSGVGEQDGLSESFNENGKLKFRGHYKNGEPDGLHESFHDNGELEFKKNYKEGLVEDGLFESFHDNGQLSKRGKYIHGGLYCSQEEYYENGQEVVPDPLLLQYPECED